VPGYEYGYERNLEDHGGVPARSITVRVWARARDGQISPAAAVLTVQNPAPDMSQIIPQVLPAAGGLVIDWKAFASSDYDLDRFDVLVDTVNPPVTVAVTRDIVSREAIVLGLTNGVVHYVRIVPYDAFGIGIASQIVSETPIATEAVDFFTRAFHPEGVSFAADPATNTVTWTAGRLTWTVDGASFQETDILSGFGTWTTGALIVYWILGESTFRVTTSMATALGADKAIMAVYTGAAGLIVNYGKAIVHGSDIVANSIGANQLVVNSAIITGVAQIANAIITNAHIADVSADKLTAGSIVAQLIIGAGRIATATAGARVEMRQDGLEVINASGASVFRAQATAPFVRIGRTIAAGAAVPPLEMSSLGDFQQLIAEHIRNLEIVRYVTVSHAEARAQNGSLAETVIETFNDIIKTLRAGDTIWTVGQIAATAQTNAGFSVPITVTVRLRRGTTTAGTIIAQAARTLTVGAKGGGPASGSVVVYVNKLQAPNLADTFHDYVLTVQIAGEAGVTTTGTASLNVGMAAKSA
jgi:hypothetical protein